MDKKISNYAVATAANYDRFIDEVRKYLSSGWQPYGSFCATSVPTDDTEQKQTAAGPYHTRYFQAMVKYES